MCHAIHPPNSSGIIRRNREIINPCHRLVGVKSLSAYCAVYNDQPDPDAVARPQTSEASLQCLQRSPLLHLASIGFLLVFPDKAATLSLLKLVLQHTTKSLAEVQVRIFMQERWLSVEEIAAHLGVNPDTIYKWIDRKKMPGHKVGRLWKFLASEVDEWVKDGSASERGRRKSAGP
jgi:excisionase family DNA binding protein